VTDVEERLTGRVLVVDDEAALLLVMEQYLRRLGYEVTSCRSGREAWELFERQPSYSLVVLDITMPGMTGNELLARMLRLSPAICVLVCSGYPFDTASIPAPACQVGFLQKPFTPKMLAEAVNLLLGVSKSATQS
jgi:CheY-like chemotaxis protein